jgi:adenosylmethionine-8-amino-7-oxononanoate aminotransferase
MSELIALDRRHVWHPFTQEQTAPDPVGIARGRGAILETVDGRELLDLISSWWVNLHGHAHPYIAEAVAAQARELEQVIFAGFTHEPAVRLASRLAEKLPGDLNRVFFSDDGSTAVEVGLKLAVQYWRNRGEPRERLLAFDGGYHGDTVGAMSVGRGSGFFEAFSPLLFDVARLPFPETWLDDPDVDAREQAAFDWLEAYLDEYGSTTAAMILEPLVQGAGGMRMCRPGFVREVARRLRACGILLVFDEVMTGFGRTGELFAAERADVTPDIICLSKGLTGGFLPLSVTVASEAVYETFLAADFDRAFTHGHSFTANSLGCAAANASLDLLETGDARLAWGRIESAHAAFLEHLDRHPRVSRRRLTGTIAAFDVSDEQGGYNAAVGTALKKAFLDRGLLLRPLGNVVYFLPPYCVDDMQLARAYDRVIEVLDELY